MARPITLPAALRDVADGKPLVRNIAVRHLAGLLLDALGSTRPVWRAADQHERGPAVRDALRRCARDDEDAGIRALAATGLGQLGDEELVEIVTPWIERDAVDLDATFARECGLIALSLLGEAAREAGAAPELVETIARRLARALSASVPDARYQAAQGLVTVLENDAEPDLVRALQAEQDVRVRAGIASALAELDPPGPAACDALRPYLTEAERDPSDAGRETAFAAALALAAARDPDGGPALVRALEDREHRERALEALAVLGADAPREAALKLRALAERWWVARVTRVRAAYALSRIEPARGEALLTRFERSPFRSVREAVVDARRGLDRLARRDESSRARAERDA